jgi:hypothetical protein
MQFLNTQAEFEELWTATAAVDASNNKSPLQSPWLVYFTKNDCAPCQLLDKDALVSAALIAGLPFYVVNQSINKYTPGFCNVYRFPTFAIIKGRKILGTLTSSKTAAVTDWISDFVTP